MPITIVPSIPELNPASRELKEDGNLLILFYGGGLNIGSFEIMTYKRLKRYELLVPRELN